MLVIDRDRMRDEMLKPAPSGEVLPDEAWVSSLSSTDGAGREWTIWVCPDGHVSTHHGPCIARDPKTCDTYHRPPRPDTEPKKVVLRERTRVLEEALTTEGVTR